MAVRLACGLVCASSAWAASASELSPQLQTEPRSKPLTELAESANSGSQAAITATQIATPQMPSPGQPTHEPGHQRPPTQYLTQTGDWPSVQRDVGLMSTRVDFDILLADDTPAARQRAEDAINAAIAEFERVVSVMSEWVEGTEVSQINAAAGRHRVVISDELYRLLEVAQQVSELSNGAFDITFRSAGKLWDFRAARVPSAGQVAQAIEHIDWRRLELTAADAGQSATARITDPNTSIGLGAIAKGYAIDRAVQIIRAAGFDAFAVNAGGDLYVAGRHGERLWNVGIQHPRDRQRLLANLPASNLAVATSGDYERFFIHEGRRYSHIINPHTGYPADSTRSVTVISGRAFWADAIATAVSVLGPEQGMRLVERLVGVETLIVDANGAISMSSGFERVSGLAGQ